MFFFFIKLLSNFTILRTIFEITFHTPMISITFSEHFTIKIFIISVKFSKNVSNLLIKNFLHNTSND